MFSPTKTSNLTKTSSLTKTFSFYLLKVDLGDKLRLLSTPNALVALSSAMTKRFPVGVTYLLRRFCMTKTKTVS